ncbi:hypothetical protein D3C85_1263710 [compost metagenome]
MGPELIGQPIPLTALAQLIGDHFDRRAAIGEDEIIGASQNPIKMVADCLKGGALIHGVNVLAQQVALDQYAQLLFAIVGFNQRDLFRCLATQIGGGKAHVTQGG